MSLIMSSTAILMFFGLSAATCIQDLNGINTLCTSEGFMQTPPDDTSLLQVGSHYAQGERRGVSAGHAAPSPGAFGYSKPVMAKPVMNQADSKPEMAEELEREELERELDQSQPLVDRAEQIMDQMQKQGKLRQMFLGETMVKPEAPAGDTMGASDSDVVEANSLLLPIDHDGAWLEKKWADSNKRLKSWTVLVDRGNLNQEYLGLDDSKGTFYETTTSGTSLKLRANQPTEKMHQKGAEVLLLQEPWGTLIKGFRHQGPDKMFCLMLGGYSMNPYKFKGAKVITWMDQKGTPYYTQVEHVGQDKHGMYLLFLKDSMIESDDFFNDYVESPVRPIIVTTDSEAEAVYLKPH